MEGACACHRPGVVLDAGPVGSWPARRLLSGCERRYDARVRLRSFKLRLRPLNEAEAYARCHGTRGADVRIVHLEPKRPRYQTPVSGEDLRRSFEHKLDEREPHEQAGV